MNHTETITKFYQAFAEGNSIKMLECYHKDVVFTDPVFGTLNSERVRGMWQMLLSQKKETTTITFSDIISNADEGSAKWTAKYFYGSQQRKVTNHVTASFQFKDGLIIKHTDTFDLWKWTKQALGVSGYLLGWTGFMKNKIQQTTNNNLDQFLEQK